MKDPGKVRIVLASDTHSQNLTTKWEWPEADIFIHAGDFTARGHIDTIKKVGREILQLGYRYNIIVPGNHDRIEADSANAWKLLPGVILLQDETIKIMGLWIHGMSWLRYRPNVFPSQLVSTDEIMAAIPVYTDILISHLPPYLIMDESHDNRHLGSTMLLQRVEQVKPRIHVFGHTHKDYGIIRMKDTTFVNACLVDNFERKPTNDPIVIEITL